VSVSLRCAIQDAPFLALNFEVAVDHLLPLVPPPTSGPPSALGSKHEFRPGAEFRGGYFYFLGLQSSTTVSLKNTKQVENGVDKPFQVDGRFHMLTTGAGQSQFRLGW